MIFANLCKILGKNSSVLFLVFLQVAGLLNMKIDSSFILFFEFFLPIAAKKFQLQNFIFGNCGDRIFLRREKFLRVAILSLHYSKTADFFRQKVAVKKSRCIFLDKGLRKIQEGEGRGGR